MNGLKVLMENQLMNVIDEVYDNPKGKESVEEGLIRK